MTGESTTERGVEGLLSVLVSVIQKSYRILQLLSQMVWKSESCTLASSLPVEMVESRAHGVQKLNQGSSGLSQSVSCCSSIASVGLKNQIHLFQKNCSYEDSTN